MRLIVGLGNPGARYARTRHNVGWLAVDRAAARWNIPLAQNVGARQGEGRAAGADVLLAAPLAWMNQVGPVVQALLRQRMHTLQDLIVIHDDLDLPLGRLRIKSNGGPGGHNGILSIITSLDSPDFIRLKIGIGRPAPGIDAAEYVLSEFLSEEETLLNDILDQSVGALESLVADGLAAAMNRYNVRPK